MQGIPFDINPKKLMDQAAGMMTQAQKQGSWDMISLNGHNETEVEMAWKVKETLQREKSVQWRIEQIKDCYFLFYQKQS